MKVSEHTRQRKIEKWHTLEQRGTCRWCDGPLAVGEGVVARLDGSESPRPHGLDPKEEDEG
jgi:hypothetical protein